MDPILRRKPPSEAEEDLNAIRKGRDLSFQDLVSIGQVTSDDLVQEYKVIGGNLVYRDEILKGEIATLTDCIEVFFGLGRWLPSQYRIH